VTVGSWRQQALIDSPVQQVWEMVGDPNRYPDWVGEEIAGVTGLVVTKLDGTARGGILVAIAERFKLPIAAIGVGEGLDDLKPFDAHDFARAIAGAKSENEAAA